MGVPESWAAIQGSWSSKGPELFAALFAKYPDAKDQFPAFAGLSGGALASSPAMAAQCENLRKGLDAVVSSIGNAGALDGVLSDIAAKHKARGMSPAYFKKAFEVFVDLFGGADAGAWKSALDGVAATLASKM